MHLYDLSATLVPAVKACFKRVRNCLLHDISPLERRINFNEEQCINFCGQHSNCSSASFSKSMAICDIYNQKNGSEGAQLVHHYDFQYYEPKLGNGSTTISQCWQENAPANMPKLAEVPAAVLVDSRTLNLAPWNLRWDGFDTKPTTSMWRSSR
uniref:Apple domain-containing protein n=1 Tax=Ditylenchus dipsaci TaxID=166011 RepID=A0A915DWA0_9BILA